MKASCRLLTLGGAVLLSLAPCAQAAVERGVVEGGVPYAMGGIGLGERVQLQSQRDRYNLWVSTAARSGAFLANVDIRVTENATGRVVLQGTMNGPWLLATLPPGRYRVDATAPETGQTLTRVLRVRDAAAQQEVLHFDDATATADARDADTFMGR